MDRSPVPGDRQRRFLEPVPGSVARTLLATHGSLALAWGLALGTQSLLGYMIALAVVVAVQTHLAVLMHEGAHWLVNPNKTKNDRITNWLAAYPIGMTVERYRRNHLLHHSRLGKVEDRDFIELCVPPLQNGLRASVVGTLTGWRHLQLLRKYLLEESRGTGARETTSLTSLVGRILWQGLFLGVAALSGQPWAYAVLWLVPLLSVGVLINELRTIVEHTPFVDLPAPEASVPLEPVTRTVRAGWLGRSFFGPLNFHYHHEHHLVPSVPFSRLPELHQALVEEGYYRDKPGLLCVGYWKIFRELWRRYRQGNSLLAVSVEDGAVVARRI